jgi:pyruvate/2-oxoglutarate dehydrogenase complex dihydrolipoamide dehydrogenase (E3) component
MDAIDLLVLGGGAAGVSAAVAAAELGRRAVVIEADRLGGVSALWGCIPSKFLLWRLYQRAHGLDPVALQAEKDAVSARVAEAQYSRILQDLGIPVVRERAFFVDPQTVVAGSERFVAERIVIATGSVPRVPPLPGLADVPYRTWLSALLLEDLPKPVLILGGGVTATELAQLFRLAGCDVTVVVRGRGLLAQSDPDVARGLTEVLVGQGVRLVTEALPLAVAAHGDEVRLEVRVRGRVETLAAAHLVLATGMRANVDALHLPAAGIEVDERGYVRHDAALRTAQPHIYVAGDAAGEPLLVPAAQLEGREAARNALQGRARGIRHARFPTAIFTEPQAGLVGQPGPHDRTFRYRLDRSARPVLEGRPEGFLKLTVAPDRRLTAAAMVGAHASDVIHLASVAIDAGETVESIAAWPVAHPTYAEILVDAVRAFLFTERRRSGS